MKNQTETFCAELADLEGTAREQGQIEWAESSQSESEAEAAGERAHYGDAWAGADEQLRRGRQGIAAMRARAAFLKAALGLDA